MVRSMTGDVILEEMLLQIQQAREECCRAHNEWHAALDNWMAFVDSGAIPAGIEADRLAACSSRPISERQSRRRR